MTSFKVGKLVTPVAPHPMMGFVFQCIDDTNSQYFKGKVIGDYLHPTSKANKNIQLKLSKGKFNQYTEENFPDAFIADFSAVQV